MKKYILLLSIILLVNTSCKKTSSSTSDVAGSIDGKIYYYTVCKDDEVICKYSCVNKSINSLSRQTMDIDCQELIAGLPQSPFKNEDNEYKEEIREIIDIILETNTLKVLKSDNPNFKDFDDIFTRWGDCEKMKNKPSCTLCQSCFKPVEGGIAGLWKKTEFEPTSDMLYNNNTQASLGKLQWSKLMGQLPYEKAQKACEDYTDFKGHSDWSLPSIKDLQDAYESNLGKELNFKDLVWSSTEAEVEIKTKNKNNENIVKKAAFVFVLPLIQNYDNKVSAQLVDKTSSYNTICIRKYNYD